MACLKRCPVEIFIIIDFRRWPRINVSNPLEAFQFLLDQVQVPSRFRFLLQFLFAVYNLRSKLSDKNSDAARERERGSEKERESGH